MSLDTGTIVTVVLFVLAFIGALLGLIYRAQQDTIRQMQVKLTEFDIKLDAETATRITQHDEAAIRLYERVERIETEQHRLEMATQQQLGDLNTTVASFSGTYAPRNELNQLREEIHARGRKP